jgi:hypothetical protein
MSSIVKNVQHLQFVIYSNGHGLSVSHTSVPNYGTLLTGAGKLNLLTTSDHKLDANAFVTRNMINIPNVSVPDFNKVGGGLDYTFKYE